MLKKGFYAYLYMYEWKKLNEISLPKKDFYCNVNMEGINPFMLEAVIT